MSSPVSYILVFDFTAISELLYTKINTEYFIVGIKEWN